MANQDKLHRLWEETDQPTQNVTLNDIGNFAQENKKKLNYRSEESKEITPSGLDYAVLKFIWCYCISIDWDINDFEWAKDRYKGKYNVWKDHPNYKVNVSTTKIQK